MKKKTQDNKTLEQVVGQEDQNNENYCQIFACKQYEGWIRKLT